MPFGLTVQQITLAGSIYGGVMLVLFLLALVYWSFKDMGARSRDSSAQLLVGAIVLLFNVVGLIIYLLLRPRETLAESYERSLEEEALLQTIEDKANCPVCAQHVHEDWQACPHCHTRLKKPCIHCGQMLQLSWDVCPHCATPQGAGVDVRSHVSRQVRVPESDWMPETSDYDRSPASSENIQFVDDDY